MASIQADTWDIGLLLLLLFLKNKASSTVVVAVSLVLGKAFIWRYLLWHLLWQVLIMLNQFESFMRRFMLLGHTKCFYNLDAALQTIYKLLLVKV